MQRDFVEFIGFPKASCLHCNLPPAPGGARFPTFADTILAPVRRHFGLHDMSGYAKLFASIVESSIWDEDPATCKVWITLLVLADSQGFIRGTSGWLSKRARVNVDIVDSALKKFQQPDPFSRTPDHDGRRIASTPDGWVILNYAFYRSQDGRELSMDARRTYQREWMRKKRSQAKILTGRYVNICQLSSQHSASASASVPNSSSSLVLSSSCELPPWYPQSEQEAIAACMASGIEEAFIRQTWNKGAGRGGLDSKSCQIRRFANHVKTEWNYELARRSREPKKMPPRETPYYPGCDPNQRNHV